MKRCRKYKGDKTIRRWINSLCWNNSSIIKRKHYQHKFGRQHFQQVNQFLLCTFQSKVSNHQSKHSAACISGCLMSQFQHVCPELSVIINLRWFIRRVPVRAESCKTGRVNFVFPTEIETFPGSTEIECSAHKYFLSKYRLLKRIAEKGVELACVRTNW